MAALRNDPTQEVLQVRKKARILVFTVSIIVMVEILFAVILAQWAVGNATETRQKEIETAFKNYQELVVYNLLMRTLTGYAFWAEIGEEINKKGDIPENLADDWQTGNTEYNDYAAILHKGEVLVEGGQAVEDVAKFIQDPRFHDLYEKTSMVKGSQEKRYIVHFNGKTIFFVMSPNADSSGDPNAEGVQIFASVFDNALSTAGSFMNARVSFDEIPGASETFTIPIADSLDEKSIRYLHVAPNISLRPLVFVPMFGSLAAQVVITIGIIIVFFVLLGTITKLFHQINVLYDELKKNNERLEAELKLAGYVQRGILPEEGSYRGRLPIGRLAIKFAPSQQVSGDVYDIAVTEDAEWVIMMDLTGHGLPAALLTTFATMAFREEVTHCAGPEELFKKMSDRLGHYLPEGTFVVAICAKLTGEVVEFSSAGGEDCYFYRKRENKMYALKSSGTMLGIVGGASEWQSYRFQLEPGDRLLFFSDGILDIPVADGGKLGGEAFLNICRKHLGLHPQQVVDKVFTDIEGLAKPDAERDDVTMLCIGKDE